ncbi:hypothetical protein [Xanthomonas vasicola]|uniref:hypothetical protein n=1 Tax=Xanthomonas vasicola TaxID=56459 RepID=UPI001459C6A4|nr:hypothetical protein [Xanthomonas vasicola]HHZ56465.1 hypothetical protein [Xanthomonas vasicola pv. zeae]
MSITTHETGSAPIQPMRSGYYWFIDQHGSLPEIVEVDVDEGFVHLIARDSPLYFPGAEKLPAPERVAFGSFIGPLAFQSALSDARLMRFNFEQQA